MRFWSEIWRKKAVDWTYGELSASQVPDGLATEEILPDSSYVHVFLRSLRVKYLRKGLGKFFGAVHSHIALPHRSDQLAEFNVVTTPDRLKNVDASNLDAVISMNTRLLGPVPFRAGDMEMEIGLFSIASSDLAGPFISLLEDLSTVAGVAFLNQALPFAGPIANGINLLADAGNPSKLEIGYSTTLDKPKTGYISLIRTPKDTIDLAQIRVDRDYRLVFENGDAVVDPYMLVAVETTTERNDWFRIPDISAAYSSLRELVRKGNVNEAEKAFEVFSRIARTSPDLLSKDSQRIVQLVSKELRDVLTASLTSSPVPEMRPLQDLKLYDSN